VALLRPNCTSRATVHVLLLSYGGAAEQSMRAHVRTCGWFAHGLSRRAHSRSADRAQHRARVHM
jgi:hypothetical protein